MRGDVRAGDAAAARSPRTSAAAPAPEFAALLDSLTRDVHDPVARLRVLRTSLERYSDVEQAVTALPSSRARRLVYRLVRLESLRLLVSGAPRWRRAARFALAGGALAAVLVAALPLLRGHGWAAASATAPVPGGESSEPTGGAGPPRESSRPAPAPPDVALPRPALGLAGPASALPPTPAPDVWLVEKGRDYELYSNGLRIETAFTTEGAPRRFRPFDLEGRLHEEVFDRPVGLLYHTSESDIWPMQASYNENLRDSSHQLLRYLRRERVYNYLIDRFGRVYRVVAEAQRANHAGHSIWAAGGRVYLNLNNAFLGVCFESRWGGGNALPITEAQLQAGRLLTGHLRQRWHLAADMCVTHGLTSVNPQKHLIGHHVDWARGFPFEAFGLPDQYARAAPSVALFGFGYDDELLKKMDAPWEGVHAAERLLEAEARQRGMSVDGLRRERRALYDRWIAEQARGEGAAPAAAQRASEAQSAPPPVWRTAPDEKALGVSGG